MSKNIDNQVKQNIYRIRSVTDKGNKLWWNDTNSSWDFSPKNAFSTESLFQARKTLYNNFSEFNLLKIKIVKSRVRPTLESLVRFNQTGDDLFVGGVFITCGIDHAELHRMADRLRSALSPYFR